MSRMLVDVYLIMSLKKANKKKIKKKRKRQTVSNPLYLLHNESRQLCRIETSLDTTDRPTVHVLTINHNGVQFYLALLVQSRSVT